jgi:hypothetical protein
MVFDSVAIGYYKRISVCGGIMKKFSLLLAFLLVSPLALAGAGPYNLEGIQALNVLVVDENSAISPQLKNKIAEELKSKLEKNGIKSKKESVGALFVKINSLKSGKNTVVCISFGIGEEARIERAGQIDTFAVSYSNSDLFESEDVDADVYDAIVNFLMEEFLEQFREDNEE